MGETAFSISLTPCPDLTDLESLWCDLEQRAAPNFFLSWTWMGSWLSALDAHPSLLRVLHGSKTVALGFIGQQSRRVLGMSIPGLYLNQTGVVDEDALFIEFNQLLLDQSCADDAFQAVLRFMHDPSTAELPHWDECFVNGIAEDTLASIQRLGYAPVIKQRRKAPFRDLTHVGEGGVLAGLSRNTRYQIQRSLKAYTLRGNVTLRVAQDETQTLLWLNALKELHQRTWQGRGLQGAFANATFASCVENLVRRGSNDHCVDLLQAKAGDHVIGYLINFIERERVLNYQSGFCYEDDPHIKPGFVSHVLAMDHYKERGFSVYHFLAGDSQYKMSLADQSETLYWTVLQKPTAVLAVEQALRTVKTWMMPRSGAG